MRTEHCPQTLWVLAAFAAAPCIRLQAAQRAERCDGKKRVRRRAAALQLLLVAMIASRRSRGWGCAGRWSRGPRRRR